MTPSQADPLEAAIAAAIEPIRAQFRALDADEQRLQNELAAVRKRRIRALQALRLLAPEDPIVIENSTSKPGPKKEKKEVLRGSHGRVGAEKVDEIEQYLRTNYNGSEFHANEVANKIGLSKTTVRAAIDILHSRGTVTLDHIGIPGATGAAARARMYKLTGKA